MSFWKDEALSVFPVACHDFFFFNSCHNFPHHDVQIPVLERIFLYVFSADDAKEAVKLGVDGILVSNHGARQLDGVPATVSSSANKDQVFSAFGFLLPSTEYVVDRGKNL